MIYIGIDPGLSGGIAAIDESGQIVAAETMAVINIGKKNVVDLKYMRAWLRGHPPEEQFVTIEKIIPIGGKREKVMILSTRKIIEVSIGRGIASTAYFQQQYGELIGLMVGLGIPFITVAPQSWKAEIFSGQPWKGNKNFSILYVQQRFPNLDLRANSRCRKPHDGKADAICLALFGKKDKEF